MYDFPANLARIVVDLWPDLVAGEYEAPPCPTEGLLRKLLETCYLAASTPEEARYPKFNIAAFPLNEECFLSRSAVVKFDTPRHLTVQEIRRLAPTIDMQKSAICAAWEGENWWIVGLMDMGTSWHRAKIGLGYRYKAPTELLVQIDRPGRIRVNQGAFHVASLQDGEIFAPRGIDLNPFFHEIATGGQKKLGCEIHYPDYEHPRDFDGFEFVALINTYTAIAATIGASEHGGMVVIELADGDIDDSNLKIKYRCNSQILRDAFITFMNARHTQGDFLALLEDGHAVPESAISKAEIVSRDAFDNLVEATRFVASLSGCDGAIVLSDDLQVVGFGAEIKAELSESSEIFEEHGSFEQELYSCDMEQFGMRHRSAIKLVSQLNSYRVLAISQDGPVSGVYSKGNRVFVRKGMNMINLNLPWA